MEATNYVAAAKGIGAPDGEVAVCSSLQRAGLLLDYNENLEIGGLVCSNLPGPSPLPFVRGPLAAGEVAYAVNFANGLVGISVTAGFTITLVT